MSSKSSLIVGWGSPNAAAQHRPQAVQSPTQLWHGRAPDAFAPLYRRFQQTGQARLRVVSVCFLMVAIAIQTYLWWTAPDGMPASQLWLGTASIFMGWIPTYAYLRDRNRAPLPFFEMICLYYCFAFSVTIVTGVSVRAVTWADEINPKAILCVIAAQACLSAGFYSGRHMVTKILSPYRLSRKYSLKTFKLLAWCLISCHLLAIIKAVNDIPSFNQFHQYAGDVGVGLFVYLWRKHLLSIGERTVLIAGVLPLSVLSNVTSGLLSGLMLLGLLILCVLWALERVVPWKSVALAIVCLSILNAVKFEYRLLTWGAGQQAETAMFSKAYLLQELAVDHVLNSDKVIAPRTATLLDRVSMMGFLSHIVDQSPNPIPYLDGESYVPLVYSLIPRIVWPGKPRLLSGYWFTERYGMRSPGDDVTSFNVPWLPELYANFGIFGVTVGMFAIGLLLAGLDRKFNSRGMSPVEQVVGIALIYGIIYQESSLVMVGTLVPAAVVFYFLFGGVTRGGSRGVQRPSATS